MSAGPSPSTPSGSRTCSRSSTFSTSLRFSFSLFLPNEKLPEFELASVYHKSSIRSDWSLIVTDKEDVYSSPLPTGQDAAVHLQFEQPVLVTVLVMLNPQSICHRFGPFRIASAMSLAILPGKVELTNASIEIQRRPSCRVRCSFF
jgi:hypothetical protein